MQAALVATMVGSAAALQCYIGYDYPEACGTGYTSDFATYDCGSTYDACYTYEYDAGGGCVYQVSSCYISSACDLLSGSGFSCCYTNNCNGVGQAAVAAAAVAAAVVAYAL